MPQNPPGNDISSTLNRLNIISNYQNGYKNSYIPSTNNQQIYTQNSNFNNNYRPPNQFYTPQQNSSPNSYQNVNNFMYNPYVQQMNTQVRNANVPSYSDSTYNQNNQNLYNSYTIPDLP